MGPVMIMTRKSTYKNEGHIIEAAIGWQRESNNRYLQ
jgi:hypothetical protein